MCGRASTRATMKHACVQTLWLVQMRFTRSQKGASAPGRAPRTRKQHDFEQTTGNSGLAVALPLHSCITLSLHLSTRSHKASWTRSIHTQTGFFLLSCRRSSLSQCSYLHVFELGHIHLVKCRLGKSRRAATVSATWLSSSICSTTTHIAIWWKTLSNTSRSLSTTSSAEQSAQYTR